MRNAVIGRIVSMLCALMLVLALLPASAGADGGFALGQAFPDFTATDTEGKTFTLSEALKSHEAALINIWATWCPPCRAEFPHLQKAYEKYGDRVAFIALSCEPTDTVEKIASFRREYGLTLPMGRDEGQALVSLIGAGGIPDTVIVDRFGNAAFLQVGSFSAAGDVERMLEAFLGDGYTESRVLDGIPPEASTRAYPVTGVRALYPDGDGVKEIAFRVEGEDEPFIAYVAEGGTVHLRIGIAGTDSPGGLVYYDSMTGRFLELDELLDPETGAYAYDQPLPGPGDPDCYAAGVLIDLSREDPDAIEIYVIAGEARVEEFAGLLAYPGGGAVTWETGEVRRPESGAAEAYTVRFADQYGDPVPGVFALFCTDEACTMETSDERGIAVFGGAPGTYHVKLLTVPEGYGFDEGFEAVIGPEFGEWIVRLRKDR